MGRPLANWQCLTHPQSVNFSPIFCRHKQSRLSVPHLNCQPKRYPMVDCGMVDFLDRDRRSNSVLLSRFGQGIKPPRRPNFAQNMHPIKRCRRSIARTNRATPEYPNVDHGVAVGRPRRFCFITHIAFVGGMGGWCCGAPYSWCD